MFHRMWNGHDMEKSFVKIEDKETKKPQLHFESKIYDELQGVNGIPKKLGYWSDRRSRYLVMERLGPSLKDLLEFCDGKFSLKTVLLLAEQLLNRLQSLHSRKILYRNVKPENLMTLVDETGNNKVYLVDFCSSKHFVDSGGCHIEDCGDKKIIGSNTNMLFHSVNNHRGHELSRRDDLESLGYLLIYFLKGSLPWTTRMGLTSSQNNANTWKLKLSIDPELLCEGLPMEFATYVRYFRKLKFQERPDYDYLVQMFRVLYRIEDFEYDNQYDWVKKNENVKHKDNLLAI